MGIERIVSKAIDLYQTVESTTTVDCWNYVFSKDIWGVLSKSRWVYETHRENETQRDKPAEFFHK